MRFSYHLAFFVSNLARFLHFQRWRQYCPAGLLLRQTRNCTTMANLQPSTQNLRFASSVPELIRYNRLFVQRPQKRETNKPWSTESIWKPTWLRSTALLSILIMTTSMKLFEFFRPWLPVGTLLVWWYRRRLIARIYLLNEEPGRCYYPLLIEGYPFLLWLNLFLTY